MSNRRLARRRHKSAHREQPEPRATLRVSRYHRKNQQHAANERYRPAHAGVRARDNGDDGCEGIEERRAAHRRRLQPDQHKVGDSKHNRAADTQPPRPHPAETRGRHRRSRVLLQ